MKITHLYNNFVLLPILTGQSPQVLRSHWLRLKHFELQYLCKNKDGEENYL